eukprot:CAMPEP_0117586796 /NCGR_PEP_ID=MMETSP0784-20121206/68922_1 /TAXON_ID=39447 /ORGANISM="" /LENGTH=45 /DNA_ID= /DNA_START= /DNA_END= /DNA_ORIENTATION=
MAGSTTPAKTITQPTARFTASEVREPSGVAAARKGSSPQRSTSGT